MPWAVRARLAAGLDRAEHAAPHGVVRLLGREVHPGVDRERLLEVLAALPLAAGDAVDEREVLVGRDPVALPQALLDRALQALLGLLVLPVLVLLEPGAERLLRLGRLEEALHLAHDGIGSLAAGEGNEQHKDERSGHFRNLCLILIASPAFTFSLSTWLGKVELRSSIVCEPAGISSVRRGGLTPRLLPSISTSPQGSTASSRRARSAGRGLSPARSSFLSRRAWSFFSNLPLAAAAARRWPGALEESSMVLAAMAPPTTRKKASGAASSAERSRPSGPMPASQPPSRACTIDSVCA